MNLLVIRDDAPGATINPNIYGHFAEHLGHCIYEGLWVGNNASIPNVRGLRSDVVGALRRLAPPVLRWPGGCFADDYHWQDGIGPRETRPVRINAHWGGVDETNAFGTHEFMDLCAQIGAAPYICGNVGSGSPREMREWIEYITAPSASTLADRRRRNGRDAPWALPYFGIGNENWGCGGHMRPEYYADLYRQFATYVRRVGDNRIQRIACGPSGGDVRWTEVLMREAGRQMDGLSLHYYTHVGRPPLSDAATGFGEPEWFAVMANALRIEGLLAQHVAVMDRHDPERRVGLIVDEWGTWYRVEPQTNPGFLFQQNSIRDALAAALHLHAFQAQAARVRMANIAQTVNVLQAMVLTRGPEMLLTPTYHVFEMFAVHQGATVLPTELSCDVYRHGGQALPALSAAASRDSAGVLHLSLCNLHATEEIVLNAAMRSGRPQRVSGRVLQGAAIDAHNTFEAPDAVAPVPFAAVRQANAGLEIVLPPRSVTVLELI